MWIPLRRLAPYVWKHKWRYLWLVVLMLLNVASSLCLARFLQSFTNAALHHNMVTIPWMFAIGVVLAASAGLLTFMESYIRDTVIQAVERDVQNDLYAHILRVRLGRLEAYQSGDVVTRITYDIHRIGAAVGLHMLHFFRLTIMAIGTLVYLVLMNAELTIVAISIIPPVLIFSLITSRVIRANSLKIAQSVSDLQSLTYQSLLGLHVIRAFKLEALFKDKFQRETREIYSLGQRNSRLAGGMMAAGTLSHFVSFLLSFSVGAYYVATGHISMGDLIAFMTLIQYLVGPMMGAPKELGGYQAAMAATTRIWAIMDEATEAAAKSFEMEAQAKSVPCKRNPDNHATLASLPLLTSASQTNKMEVEIDHVSFTYPQGIRALHDISFSVPAGSTAALVGANGAGKSTVFKLLLGFYDVDEGDIRFNGTSIQQLVPDQLRSLISYVPQETFLFTGTVRDNIRYGMVGASDRAVIRAAMAANAHDFICALPQGYDTVVGESALHLSGGQRQRIAIARAFLRDAPILLLDEATSSLDAESEHLVYEATNRLMTDRTTFVIAHRLTTVRNADHVFVLDQGRIAEHGTHENLLERRGIYEHLYRLQIPGSKMEIDQIDFV
ncbi:ABC transporter ATP-binding protein [Alicyclobacillus ferrooxydans]|uniref:ABC transporter ATP-binding protein n=1 Tax=Alicyclobacillus ferrooxydans TaxID=471514 RepID=UPI0014704CE3|nr:ABC transporter ATP-binding protein [Alicyclobacillus ferrooxydans]